MTATSLRAFLHHIVDYAGLFPPARLDMATTVRNYASYLAGDDAWMLGRLVVPVARFDEFEQAAKAYLPVGSDDAPWHISAVTAPAGEDACVQHIESIAAFNARHADPANGRAVVDAVEVKASSTVAIDAALDALPDDIFPFFEIAASSDPRGMIAAMVGSDAGAKIRTGGETPDMVPRPEDVARFIAACASSGVPFKATAGLHHPLRNVDETVGAMMYGFFNVFMAAALAHQADFEVPDLHEVLTDDAIENFRFSDDRAAWQVHEVDLEQIEACRAGYAISFGSCSFDEPREDLRALNLI